MQELTGIENTWGQFSRLSPAEVCKRAHVSFDQNLQVYEISSFGQNIHISKDRRELTCASPQGKYLLSIDDYFFDLSVLWYLISAKNIPLSGNLIKPSDVAGGQIFMKGTHVLPLDEIALKFNDRKESFLDVGREYGGIEAEHGDVSVQLLPFPGLPVYIILWFGDEDFPAKGQLLLDSSCSSYLPTDVLWAMSMVCCLIFLTDP